MCGVGTLHNFLHSCPWRTVIYFTNIIQVHSLCSTEHISHARSDHRIPCMQRRLTSYIPGSQVSAADAQWHCPQASPSTLSSLFPTLGRTTNQTKVHTNLTLQRNVLYEKQTWKVLARFLKMFVIISPEFYETPQTKISIPSFYFSTPCYPLPEIWNNRIIRVLMILEGYGSNLAFLLGTNPASA